MSSSVEREHEAEGDGDGGRGAIGGPSLAGALVGESEGALGQVFERTNTAIDRVGLVAPITYGDLTYRQFAVVCGLT